ncbi:MAG TPA: helix-turn-helix transcriptional regulator [Gemmatimonadaceae bacterium]
MSEQRPGGAELRRRRQEARRSLRDVASELGVSAVYLSDIERGNRPIPRNELGGRLLELFGIDPADLPPRDAEERAKVERAYRRGLEEGAALALVRDR